jgi:ATP-dependent DNA helicase RecQ
VRTAARLTNLAEQVAESGGPTGAGKRAVAAVIERAEAHRRLQQSRVDMMRGYAETPRCRADFLLGYFGEPVEKLCGCCDNCRAGVAALIDPGNGTPFAVQSNVEHPSFGPGVVTDIEEDRLTVLFEEVGYKTLSLELVEREELLGPGVRG